MLSSKQSVDISSNDNRQRFLNLCLIWEREKEGAPKEIYQELHNRLLKDLEVKDKLVKHNRYYPTVVLEDIGKLEGCYKQVSYDMQDSIKDVINQVYNILSKVNSSIRRFLLIIAFSIFLVGSYIDWHLTRIFKLLNPNPITIWMHCNCYHIKIPMINSR